jgi:E1A/CREB-binding protein
MYPPCALPAPSDTRLCSHAGLVPGARPDPTAPGQPGTDAQQQRMRMQYVQKQQRWLLFLRHCAKCTQNEESCQYKRNCRIGKELWHHILTCTDPQCKFARCVGSRDLLKHHQKCQVGAWDPRACWACQLHA